MKSKLALLILLLGITASVAAIPVIDESTYIVKPGDQFLIQVVSIDTVQAISPVLPEGYLSLHPVGPSILAAGKTLREVKTAATDLIRSRLPHSLISVELGQVAPTRFQLIGAVKSPGEYASSTMPTLYEALGQGLGMLPQASRKVTVTGRDRSTVYDLRKYLMEGDVTQNPLIQDGERIEATFANDYLRVFVNNDSTLTVEYYEISQSTPLREVLRQTLYRYPATQYSSMRLIRDGKTYDVDLDFQMEKGDDLYLATEERNVYVTGYVLNAGCYLYNGPRDVAYYISMAGGYATIGSRKKVRIVAPDGTVKDRYAAVMPGDTIYVPESSWFMIRDYLPPISSVAALVLVIGQIL